MSPGATFQRPPTAQEAVLAELRRAILEGDLRPGAQMLQDNIAERLGVSRVPVREALKILEGEGQVAYSPHRGYFVAELSYDELGEIYRIRELLEAEAVSVGMKHVTEEDLERMRVAIGDMETAADAGDIVALTAANRRFHFGLIEPCQRPRLIRLIRQLWDSTDPYRSVYFADPEHRALINKEHRAMYDAAEARDPKAAVKLMRTHRTNAIAGLQSLLRHP